MDYKRAALVLTGVCLFQGGWILGQLSDGDAHAQEPSTGLGGAASPAGTPRLLCRAFAQDPASLRVVETSDQTSEVGQWIASMEGDGWELYGVDFELGQKSTGFPQAWFNVCLQPG